MKKKIPIILSILLCTSLLPTPKPVSAASSVTIESYNSVTNDSTNNISFCLNLKNTGSDTISLSSLSFRYYFTNEGNQENAFSCDYTPIGSSNVIGSFGATKDSRYLQIGFSKAAGSLAKGATLPVVIRIWKSDWSNFNQTNDYSFNPSDKSFVIADHIPAYINQKLVWGTETGASTSTQTPAPTSKPTSTPTSTPTVTPTNTPEVPTMKEISDAYMKNITIATDCPTTNTTRRNGVTYGTLVNKTYYSKTTNSNRKVNILLPANYNTNKKYPVLYLLHGIFENENSMATAAVQNIIGNQIANGNAKEMIVVFPNIYASANGKAPSLDAEGTAGYDNFINDLKNDLMPYIKQNYSILTDRKYQAIAGFSMGGREALYIGMTRCDLFGYVMGISPAPGLTPGRDWASTHAGMLQEDQLKIADPKYTPYAIMLCCGTQDSVVGTFPESYHNILTHNQTNHIWYTIPGADHNSRAINSGVNNFVGAIFHAD